MEADATTNIAAQSNDVTAPLAPTLTIPGKQLRPNMRASGEQSRSLGMVDALEHDAAGDVVVALVVRHGLLGRRRTRVPVERIKQVNQDSVVLQYSKADFRRLPREANS